MTEDKEFEQQLINLKKRQASVESYISLCKQLLVSPVSYTWRLLDELLNMSVPQNSIYLELRTLIQRSVRSIQSFTMLMYVYSLKQGRTGFSFYSTYWRGEYEEVVFRFDGITYFSSWISTHFKSQIGQETLWMVIRNFPFLSKSEGLNFGEIQLGSVIQWVTYFQTPDPHTDKFVDACELIKMAKQTRFSSMQTHDQSQHALLLKLIKVVCQIKCSSSNIFLFLYPMPLMNQQIPYFCQIYGDFLADIAEDGLCNLFNAITSGTVCKEVLLIIQNVSSILANEEQFYKLRYLYQKFILPVLAKRAKSCPRVQQMIFEICSKYVLGFLKHCDIGEEGVRCLVKNIGRIRNQYAQAKWIQLCSAVCNRYPYLKPEADKLIHAELGKHVDLSQYTQDPTEEAKQIWNITVRNGRKHKKYVRVQSQMRGITNKKNECYIISIVHGLQKCHFLQKLLDKYRVSIKGKFKILDELRTLFNQISGNRRAEKIYASYLKKVSPEQFARSEHQEDAYEYLIKLFDVLQMEMKNIPGLVEQFKAIFEIQELSTIECSNCKELKNSMSQTYVHTISNTSILTELTEEALPDFHCQKCELTGSCFIRRELKLKNRILIVHINRFAANADGTIRKELSTQRILRRFLNYELVGIICHKGKRVESGHYVYYHQISPKRWGYFNDNSVEEFELEQQYEQFEREWKSQMTPYILFYKQIGAA